MNETPTNFRAFLRCLIHKRHLFNQEQSFSTVSLMMLLTGRETIGPTSNDLLPRQLIRVECVLGCVAKASPRNHQQETLSGSSQPYTEIVFSVLFPARHGRITSTQTFRLPNRFTLEIAGFYQSRSLNGISIRRPFGVLNVGVQKQLAANRGTLRLTGEDLLWSNIMVYENNNPDAGFSLRSNGPGAHNRLVRLTYSRSFGNQKVSVNSKRATGSDDERRRVN